MPDSLTYVFVCNRASAGGDCKVIESVEARIVSNSFLLRDTYTFSQTLTSHVVKQYLTEFVFGQPSSHNTLIVNSSNSWGLLVVKDTKKRL